MPWTRDLRLLAGAAFLSSAGDLFALIVLALHVHDLTGSGLAVSALFATTLVPAVAVAPLAGLAADRFESVSLLVATSLMGAVVAAALAFAGELVGEGGFMGTVLGRGVVWAAGRMFWLSRKRLSGS